MRALRFDQTLVYQPQNPEPSPAEGDTLIAITTAGICSTDLEICKGYMGFAGILGHEFVGVVLESPAPELVGRRVCGEINIVCGTCSLCRSGLSNHCTNRSVLGILKHPGAFAERVRLPAANLHLVPDSVDDEQAVFVEPLAAAFQILRQVPITPQTTITILGDGRLGLLVAPDFNPPDLSGTDDPPPSLDFRFSNFYTVPRNYVLWSGVSEYTWHIQASLDSAMFWSMRDCNIHGGNTTVGPPDWSWMPLNYLYGEGSISWVNNLFDQVALFLDPTYYPSGYNDLGLNVDMSFSAYNNLFRGGGWFHLEPVPASAGHWVFSDNLFEKVHFVQNTNMPLDYGHNAYWQLTETELSAWGWGTNHLLAATNGAGTGELLLAASPSYQRGPLGDYYLPITTPLYHAGSRTPAEAGLFHYTTRVDQLKAGEEPGTHNASIGLHYLSTSNGAPKDADTDGISDYLENWHGDGSYSSHIDTETDWQVSFTISGVYDPTNAIYDDRDLSGSGLVGAVKKALSLAPFDIANPLTLLGLNPAQPVLGECAFPLLLTDHSNAAGALILYADGQQAETGEVRQATNANWFAFWDTTALANSHHSLQVGYSYISASGIQRTVYGPLALPQISNPITFDPINDGFSSVLYIRGTLKQPVYAYTIDLYSDDSQHTLLATITNTPVGNTIEDS